MSKNTKFKSKSPLALNLMSIGLFLFFLFQASAVNAQQNSSQTGHHVDGTVTSESGESLIGVSILVMFDKCFI